MKYIGSAMEAVSITFYIWYFAQVLLGVQSVSIFLIAMLGYCIFIGGEALKNADKSRKRRNRRKMNH